MPATSSISASPEQSSSSIGTGSTSGSLSSVTRDIVSSPMPSLIPHNPCVVTLAQLRQGTTNDCHRCVITVHHKKNRRCNNQQRNHRARARHIVRLEHVPFRWNRDLL